MPGEGVDRTGEFEPELKSSAPMSASAIVEGRGSEILDSIVTWNASPMVAAMRGKYVSGLSCCRRRLGAGGDECRYPRRQQGNVPYPARAQAPSHRYGV